MKEENTSTIIIFYGTMQWLYLTKRNYDSLHTRLHWFKEL